MRRPGAAARTWTRLPPFAPLGIGLLLGLVTPVVTEAARRDGGLPYDPRQVGTWKPQQRRQPVPEPVPPGPLEEPAPELMLGVEDGEVDWQNRLFASGAIGLIVIGFTWSFLRVRRRNRRGARRVAEAIEAGLDRPPSLHPLIDAKLCVGCGTCVAVCPDQTVLGLVENQARLINGAHCVGHGLCARSCPVGAIQLVYGTEDRPIELPTLDGRYQSNLPGVYVAGELGGMGLIANALEQGVEAVNHIAEDLRGAGRPGGQGQLLDLIVAGAGPAGLGASLRAQELGLSYLCIEQEAWGGAIRSYPRGKQVMTRPLRVPVFGPVKLRGTSKEELVALWQKILGETGLHLQDQTRLLGLRRQEGALVVETSRGELRARRLLLCIGRRGSPQKMGVPGEDQAHVAFSMLEPEAWAGQRLVVVGGGDMACEVALALAAQPGTMVRLAYRGEALSRPKPENRRRVTEAAGAGQLQLLLRAQARRVTASGLVVSVNGAAEEELPADQIFVCIGGTPPREILTRLGIELVTLRGEPRASAS